MWYWIPLLWLLFFVIFREGKTQRAEKVYFAVLVPISRVQEITKAVTEATSGQAVIEEEGNLYYAVLDGEYVCFD